MSPPIDQKATRAPEDEAIGWLVRVQSDAATDRDWVALTAWLEMSEAHALAFARAEHLSDAIVDNADEIAAATAVGRLTHGEEVSHAVGSTASHQRRVYADTAFAWRAGRRVCEDEMLAQIVADLNRRYPLPIHLSESAGARRFSGVLDLGDQGVLVRQLADYLSLSVRRTDQAITLS